MTFTFPTNSHFVLALNMKAIFLVAVCVTFASLAEGRTRVNWYNDFEDGSLGTWSDVSTSDVTWAFEDVGTNIVSLKLS